MQAILNWIKGNNSAGQPIPVPTLFGGNYQVRAWAWRTESGGKLWHVLETLVRDATLALHRGGTARLHAALRASLPGQ